jgi:hypothetical protein
MPVRLAPHLILLDLNLPGLDGQSYSSKSRPILTTD